MAREAKQQEIALQPTKRPYHVLAELIQPYTERGPWLVWDLLQEGAEIELQAR